MTDAAAAAALRDPVGRTWLGAGPAVVMFLAFAFAYFLSALLRAVVATLAPAFGAEFNLGAGHLGLLAGAYFLGFSLLQLPMGAALDRYGPKRLLLALLTVAVLGCAGFALAGGFAGLMGARLLIGVGVAGCLMAPLTAYRLYLRPQVQMRANAWMLMSGSLGMLASTLPVQWAVSQVGWRWVFAGVAGAIVVGMMAIAIGVPSDGRRETGGPSSRSSYRAIVMQPMFVRFAPLGFTLYGGLVAMQTLWIGPWLHQVVGLSPRDSAAGLLLVNAAMLVAFLVWGWVAPRLTGAWSVQRVVAWCWPASVVLLATVALAGREAGAWIWMLWCVCASAVTLSQPAVAMAQPAALAGRALSAFNLVVFVGVFAIQWGIGLLVDLCEHFGWSRADGLRLGMLALAMAVALSGLWFARRAR